MTGENMARVLIAEDNEKLLRQVTQHIKNLGHEVTSTTNGTDALEKFWKNTYDIVVLDHRMPRKDGLSVLQEIRRKNRNIPILLISGDLRVQTLAEKMGAHFIAKPFLPETLSVMVFQLLRSSASQ